MVCFYTFLRAVEVKHESFFWKGSALFRQHEADEGLPVVSCYSKS